MTCDSIIRIVLKGPRLPDSGAVACDTVVRVHSRHMIGDEGRCKIGQMACVTICRQSDIFASHMAFCASCLHMSARQRKNYFRMIECCVIPCTRRMARGTIVIKRSGDVIGINDPGKICDMARIAIARCSFELSVFMAEDTVGCCMGAGQWKIFRRMSKC